MNSMLGLVVVLLSITAIEGQLSTVGDLLSIWSSLLSIQSSTSGSSSSSEPQSPSFILVPNCPPWKCRKGHFGMHSNGGSGSQQSNGNQQVYYRPPWCPPQQFCRKYRCKFPC